MPLLCRGRPKPHQRCDDESTPKPGFLAAVDSVRSFLLERQAFGTTPAAAKPPSPTGNIVQRRRVQTADRYMAARLAGRTDEVLRLVTNDVQLESSRDGKITGKDSFKQYLARVKPTGMWKRATWNRAMGKAEVLGNVKILMVNVGVIAHFGFDRSGKINQVYVGTRKKAQKT